MIDKAIDKFFVEKKEAWRKDNPKSSSEECEQKFSLENWLPDAAKRARQMSFATHPCKFSHPSASKKVTPVISNAKREADGYLRSGNVDVQQIDALGNAAVLDVYSFLTLEMEDTKKLIDHIQEKSELSVELLTIPTESYENLRDGFLKMRDFSNNKTSTTSSKIKQVYFPVVGAGISGYHQLSLLSNSGIMYELKKRINDICYSDGLKELKKQKADNIYSDKEFTELYNLTTIGYGGTKPQNISALNSKNSGKSHLLLSLPPILNKRNISFPKNNFFDNPFRYECQEIFYALHKIFKTNYNNAKIREGRDYRLQNLMDLIIDKMWKVRAVSKEQYMPKNSKLKLHQKIWLCDEYQQTRQEKNDWLDDLRKEISRWIIWSYKKLLGKLALKLGEQEWLHIHGIVSNNREELR